MLSIIKNSYYNCIIIIGCYINHYLSKNINNRSNLHISIFCYKASHKYAFIIKKIFTYYENTSMYILSIIKHEFLVLMFLVFVYRNLRYSHIYQRNHISLLISIAQHKMYIKFFKIQQRI